MGLTCHGLNSMRKHGIIVGQTAYSPSNIFFSYSELFCMYEIGFDLKVHETLKATSAVSTLGIKHLKAAKNAKALSNL